MFLASVDYVSIIARCSVVFHQAISRYFPRVFVLVVFLDFSRFTRHMFRESSCFFVSDICWHVVRKSTVFCLSRQIVGLCFELAGHAFVWGYSGMYNFLFLENVVVQYQRRVV